MVILQKDDSSSSLIKFTTNSVRDIYDCDDYTSCIAIKRIIQMLKFYNIHYNNYDEISKYLQDYKQNLISDYHHILNHHLNEDRISQNQSDEQFQWIYNQLKNTNDNIQSLKHHLLILSNVLMLLSIQSSDWIFKSAPIWTNDSFISS